MNENIIFIETYKGIKIYYYSISNTFISNLLDSTITENKLTELKSFPQSTSLTLARTIVDEFILNCKFEPLKKAFYYFISRGGYSSISTLFVKTHFNIGQNYIFAETEGCDKYPSSLTIKPKYEDDENQHFLFSYDENILAEIEENEKKFLDACKYRNQKNKEIAAKLVPFNTMNEN